MADPDWYNRPLNWEDVLAGGSLIGISAGTIIIYSILIKAMKKRDKRAALDEINELEGEGTISEFTTGHWFHRFNARGPHLEGKPCPLFPTKLNNEDLIAALEDGPSSSAHESDSPDPKLGGPMA
ncbi:hypothetical protein KIN20_018529 [Parelaphostrongylus tenuis]|uniref:Uncharacterized protein n=1 Tax=Parelaphostrongylus tenuis TaxID=148309 RepID=A0AAD5QS85_PARTN|nr:hypothetical protein KIN20_018529 [Parelaphostrongylus tenuis]